MRYIYHRSALDASKYEEVYRKKKRGDNQNYVKMKTSFKTWDSNINAIWQKGLISSQNVTNWKKNKSIKNKYSPL